MTANLIAKVVENKLNKLNINSSEESFRSSIEKYNKAIGVLEDYIHLPINKYWADRTRFFDFEETELVYKFAKDICDQRIRFKNWCRAWKFYYTEREAARIYFKWD